MKFNLLKNLVFSPVSKNLKLLNETSLISVNNYVNTKTPRKKLPAEEKSKPVWVPVKKALTTIEVEDKQLDHRLIVDPVWLMSEYKTKIFKIEDAIQFHKEMAQPAMLNNLDGFMHVRLVLDMTTKKKGKFMDNIKGSAFFPHFFSDGIKKEVVAICKNENEIEECKKAGALFAGYTDILKKFEKGEISDQSYDFLVCTPETFSDVALLKKKINKDRFPSLKEKTITEDIAETVRRFHNSKYYESAKTSDSQAVLKAKIGKINFETEKLVENFAHLITQVASHKKGGLENYINDCVLYAPPSIEKFKVDTSPYMPEEKPKAKGKGAKEADEDNEEGETKA